MRLALITFKREGAVTTPQARLPVDVTDYLRARAGDTLAVEAGSVAAAERAAESGPFAIVRLLPTQKAAAVTAAVRVVRADPPGAEAETCADAGAQSEPAPPAAPPALESIEEAVRRKRERRPGG